MKIELTKGTWDVDVFLDRTEPGYQDNVFLRIREESPEQWRLLRTNEITVGLTAADARRLGRHLIRVAAQDEAAAQAEATSAETDASDAPNRKRRPAPALPFTPKQGKYLAFIRHYLARFGCAPAEADIQRHFLVTGPAVHGMMVTLERKGLIARTPGQARSIRLLVPTELIPPL